MRFKIDNFVEAVKQFEVIMRLKPKTLFIIKDALIPYVENGFEMDRSQNLWAYTSHENVEILTERYFTVTLNPEYLSISSVTTQFNNTKNIAQLEKDNKIIVLEESLEPEETKEKMFERHCGILYSKREEAQVLYDFYVQNKHNVILASNYVGK